MVEKVIMQARNVVDFARYQAGRNAAAKTLATKTLATRACRHCGAALADGESEDDCSSASGFAAPAQRETPLKFYAD